MYLALHLQRPIFSDYIEGSKKLLFNFTSALWVGGLKLGILSLLFKTLTTRVVVPVKAGVPENVQS